MFPKGYLDEYKNDVANADIGITILKREERIMTKSEQLAVLVADMTEKELRELAQLLGTRADALTAEKAKKARQKMIEAWKEYRALCPNDYKYVTIEDTDYDLEIDLYEYMDNYLH